MFCLFFGFHDYYCIDFILTSHRRFFLPFRILHRVAFPSEEHEEE